MMFDVNNELIKCINYQSSKVDVLTTWQTMETMIKFINRKECPYYTARINGLI